MHENNGNHSCPTSSVTRISFVCCKIVPLVRPSLARVLVQPRRVNRPSAKRAGKIFRGQTPVSNDNKLKKKTNMSTNETEVDPCNKRAFGTIFARKTLFTLNFYKEIFLTINISHIFSNIWFYCLC